MQKIRKQDTVIVTKGKDRGRTGAVLGVLPPGKRTDKFGRPRPALRVYCVNVREAGSAA